MNKEKIVNLLECAKINVNNISKLGPPMTAFVNIQIDEAISLLKEPEVEDE